MRTKLSSTLQVPTELLEFISETVAGNIKGEFQELKRKLFSFEYICIETVSYIGNNNTLFLEQNIY